MVYEMYFYGPAVMVEHEIFVEEIPNVSVKLACSVKIIGMQNVERAKFKFRE